MSTLLLVLSANLSVDKDIKPLQAVTQGEISVRFTMTKVVLNIQCNLVDNDVQYDSLTQQLQIVLYGKTETRHKPWFAVGRVLESLRMIQLVLTVSLASVNAVGYQCWSLRDCLVFFSDKICFCLPFSVYEQHLVHLRSRKCHLNNLLIHNG